jgi:hypothetical protein
MVYYYSTRKYLSEDDALLQNPAVKASYQRAKELLSESVLSDALVLNVYESDNSVWFKVEILNTHKAFNRFRAYSNSYHKLRERLYCLRVCVSK